MMIVIMRADASMREKSAVIARAEDSGFKVHLSDGKERTIIGIIGDDRVINRDQIERMSGVDRVVPILYARPDDSRTLWIGTKQKIKDR